MFVKFTDEISNDPSDVLQGHTIRIAFQLKYIYRAFQKRYEMRYETFLWELRSE
jgi:hypothetical protein